MNKNIFYFCIYTICEKKRKKKKINKNKTAGVGERNTCPPRGWKDKRTDERGERELALSLLVPASCYPYWVVMQYGNVEPNVSLLYSMSQNELICLLILRLFTLCRIRYVSKLNKQFTQVFEVLSHMQIKVHFLEFVQKYSGCLVYVNEGNLLNKTSWKRKERKKECNGVIASGLVPLTTRHKQREATQKSF